LTTPKKIDDYRIRGPVGPRLVLVTFLVIVSRNRPDLYAWIRRVFFTDTRFQMIFDRRRVVRRRIKGAPVFERRQRDRRARAEIDQQLRIQGWVALPIARYPFNE